MLRKTMQLSACATLVIASAAVLALSGTGTALASGRTAPSGGLHLVPITRSAPAQANGRAAVARTSYHIENSDGQCLDANSNYWGKNGDNVQLWSCNNNGEQIWIVSGAHIVNSDGQCLDANSNYWGENGDNIQLWSCNNNGEQSWYGSSAYPRAIVNGDGQCLDANSNYWGENGDNIQLWSCNTHGEQEWGFAS